jgi:two-component system response regulator YesN
MARPLLKANTRILLAYTVPIFIIMILSLVVGWVIYHRTSVVLENEMKQSNQVLLEQGMNVMDNQFRSIVPQRSII